MIVIPFDAPLGAEVRGPDPFHALDDAIAAALERTFDEYPVQRLCRTDGERLLDALHAHCEQPRLRYVHRWRRGDMLVWDNRCVAHRARADFDPHERRNLHRIVLRGEVPVPWHRDRPAP